MSAHDSGKFLNFIDPATGKPCETAVREVLFEGSDWDVRDDVRQRWHDLLVVRTGLDRVVIRRRAISSVLAGVDSRDAEEWHVADNDALAARRLNPSVPVDKKALKKLGWWRFVAKRV